MIPFNKQNIFGKELEYIKDAYNNKISGDGKYTKLCSKFMEDKFKINKVLLTTSGTHSLDMAALLIETKPGDEIIFPSFTFVSTVNAFVLRGAKPVFCEIREDNFNIDEEKIEKLITNKTKAIVPVHYAGVACEMGKIMDIAKKYNLYVIEDAAHAINAKYKNKFLGTIGHIGCFSFHETKNFSMGEGGAILINNVDFIERAEIIREKGTNRSKFFRGQIDKYTWVDEGSSYLPSDINAAVLWAQFNNFDEIQNKRISIYNRYFEAFKELENRGFMRLPIVNDFASNNAHMFYILLNDEEKRNELLNFMSRSGVNCTFHYIPLHTSDFYKNNYGNIRLPITENISGRILRLPLFFSLKEDEVNYIIDKVYEFFKREHSIH